MSTDNLVTAETCTEAGLTEPQLLELLAQARAENAALKKAKANHGSTIKVSEKGAVSIYGLGRFPVTLYKGQWAKLFAIAEEVKAFIVANDALLSTKGE